MTASYRTTPDSLDAIRRDLDALLACQGDTPLALHDGAPLAPTCGHMPTTEPDTATEARRLHDVRQAYWAIEWGFAFLDALDLGPMALDLIDGAISDMDAVDGDADFEPWLAGTAHFAAGDMASAIDAEDDSEEDEGTALESHGRGFVRAGEDDEEDSDPAEDSDPGERCWRDYPADEDGLAEQWPGAPALAWSVGGYVA